MLLELVIWREVTGQTEMSQILALHQVGDTITLTGRENPRFYFGDDTLLNVLRMTVTAYSSIEDWVMGEITVKHIYSRPRCGFPHTNHVYLNLRIVPESTVNSCI